MARQLPLDLGHRPALGRGDFLVAPCNEVAVAWIDRWPDWPAPGLALFGPAGAGKSHLTGVWLREQGVFALTEADLDAAEPPALLSTAAGIALDDLEETLRDRPERERQLFHLFNAATASGGRLLATGRRPPARWRLTLPDLASRLASLVAIEIKGPDDALLEAVLVKLFADRQLAAKPEVIHFLSARMERSLAAAGALVAALDQASLARRREVTVPLAREVLAAAGPQQS